MQNADPMKRQRGFHVEREEPWEHTFNLSIVLQPAVMMFADWCTSDVSRDVIECVRYMVMCMMSMCVIEYESQALTPLCEPSMMLFHDSPCNVPAAIPLATNS